MLTRCSTSDVSIGAALAAVDIPSPATLLQKSALGVQVVYHDEPGTNDWLGENEAYYLFSPGCQNTYRFEHNTTNITFQLVCDPAYEHAGPGPMPPLSIAPPGDVLNAPLSFYHLSWSIPLAALPLGTVRFSIGGQRILKLAFQHDDPSLANKPILLLLQCIQVNQRRNPTKHNHEKQ